MAIEDGYIAARALSSHLDPFEALKRYEEVRLDRTARIVRGSAENAERFHNPTLASREGALAYVEQQFDETAVKERYQWLFEYDVDAVAV